MERLTGYNLTKHSTAFLLGILRVSSHSLLEVQQHPCLFLRRCFLRSELLLFPQILACFCK